MNAMIEVGFVVVTFLMIVMGMILKAIGAASRCVYSKSSIGTAEYKQGSGRALSDRVLINNTKHDRCVMAADQYLASRAMKKLQAKAALGKVACKPVVL